MYPATNDDYYKEEEARVLCRYPVRAMQAT
jgi:hypothetical protein|uniref:Uncharacterized protein n=1 Tax=Populus trichocarpa TaxID=3694 RepID=A0A3N7FHN1_POPTR